MSKVIIDFKQKRPFQDGDILIFDKKSDSFVLSTKELFLRAQINDLNALKKQYELDIAEMKKSLETFKKGINDKMKEYHDILQNLVKGEE